MAVVLGLGSSRGSLLGLWVEVRRFWLKDLVLTRFRIRGSKTWSRYGGWVLGEDPEQKTRCGVLGLCLGFDALSLSRSLRFEIHS